MSGARRSARILLRVDRAVWRALDPTRLPAPGANRSASDDEPEPISAWPTGLVLGWIGTPWRRAPQACLAASRVLR